MYSILLSCSLSVQRSKFCKLTKYRDVLRVRVRVRERKRLILNDRIGRVIYI